MRAHTHIHTVALKKKLQSCLSFSQFFFRGQSSGISPNVFIYSLVCRKRRGGISHFTEVMCGI